MLQNNKAIKQYDAKQFYWNHLTKFIYCRKKENAKQKNEKRTIKKVLGRRERYACIDALSSTGSRVTESDFDRASSA